MILPSLLLALSLGDALPPPADHILNPDFVTGVSDWRYYLDGGTHGSVTWDPAIGAPAVGSARVGSVWHDAGKDSWGQCILLPPGPFTVNVAVASHLLGDNVCELRVAVVNQNNCNVMASLLLDKMVHNTINDGSFETLTIAETAPINSGAAAVFLTHVRSATAPIGDSYCNFDHVQLNGDPVFVAHFEP